MGQEITVTARAGASPNIRMFDLNRSLTGMAIERYETVEQAQARGGRPPDVLAQRLLEAGATHVTVYSNDVTVVAPPEQWAELEPKAIFLIEHLFLGGLVARESGAGVRVERDQCRRGPGRSRPAALLSARTRAEDGQDPR